MIISNCLLSIVAAMLSIVGTYSCNGNLECFGWGMLFVAFVNAIGWIIDMNKEKRKKNEL